MVNNWVKTLNKSTAAAKETGSLSSKMSLIFGKKRATRTFNSEKKEAGTVVPVSGSQPFGIKIRLLV